MQTETILGLTELLVRIKLEAFAIEYSPYATGDTRSFAIFAGSLIAESKTPRADFARLCWDKVMAELRCGEMRKDLPWFFELHNAEQSVRELFEIRFDERTKEWGVEKISEM